MSWLWWLLVPLAYLLGAVPWGFLGGKALAGVDVREHGSGRIGMANVLRTVGVRGAALVVLGDVGKGVAPVLLARLLTQDAPVLEAAVAMAALVGHNWSVFIRFRGGRGILTGFGALTALTPLAGIVALAMGVTIIGVSRYVSLGSLVGVGVGAVATGVLYLFGYASSAYFLYSLVGGAIIFLQHRDNLVRLVQGTERRLGDKADARAPSARG